MFSKVDLPQPLGPITAMISRFSMVRLKSHNASTTESPRLKFLETWRISIMVRTPSEDHALVSAIDVDIGADHEAGALRRDEGDGIRNIVSGAPPTKRHFGAPARLL